MTYTVADITAVMDELFPPACAESWDRVGLIAGLPSDEVRSVAFAVDRVKQPCKKPANAALTSSSPTTRSFCAELPPWRELSPRGDG